MVQELVKLTKALIRLNTSHPNFEKKLECLNLIKEKIGETVHIQEFEFQNFPSLLVSTQKSNHLDLLLVGHIDVVPAPEQLFKPQIKAGKLFGRGAYDMKGAVAAMAISLRAYSKLQATNYKLKNIGLLLTSDEEIDGLNGVKAVLEKTKLTASFALLPDNGQNWEIMIAERGLIHFQAPASEKIKLVKILSSQFAQRGNENREWLTTFSTKTAFPDKEDIQARFSPHLLKLQKLIQQYTHTPALFSKETRTNESDGIYFGERNIPVALVRPLGGGMHKDDEWLDIDALEKFSKILQTFLNE
jgi:acetylornithine deacetylase/succinyl-diaminopimelate desuccinylase-like protein